MALVLQDSWLILCSRDVEYLPDLLFVEVGQPNRLDKSFIHQLFHLKPRLNIMRAVVSTVVAIIRQRKQCTYIIQMLRDERIFTKTN